MEAISYHRILRFGVFDVDLRTAELRKHGVRIRLEEQPFHILALLIAAPGELVTREELRQKLWAADTFVDFDRSLNKAISKLRLALGDSAESPRYIETLHRRGYRFIAPVQSDEPGGAHQSDPNLRPLETRVARTIPGAVLSTTARLGQWRWPLVFAVAAVLFSFTIPLYLRSRQTIALGNSSAGVVPRRSVAVLGFRNLSGRDDQAWISTALSDWLTTELSAGEQLRMIPAESVARMRIELSLPDTDSLGNDNLNRIGSNLGTDLVVVGSYASLGKEPGGQVRLDLRLQDTRTGETIEAVSETGTEARLFDLVSQAGQRLRNRLGVQAVTRTEAAEVAVALPASHDAARLYSEGLAKLRVFDALAARDLFQKAVAAEPRFALSHAALATAWATLGYDENAKTESKQAFELSSNLPRAERLLVEGRYHEMAKSWDKAIEIYRALFAFFPDSLDYGLALAHAQVSGGRGKEALDTVEALQKLPAPLGDDPRIDLAEARASESLGDFKRDLAATIKAAQKAEALGASLLVAQAQTDRAWALDNLGPLDEAVKVAGEAQHLFAAAGDRRGMAQAATVKAIALGLQGDSVGAKRVYEECLAIYRQIGDKNGVAVELNNIADQLLSLGDPVASRATFEQSLAIYQELGHQDGIAMAKSNLGGVLLILGDRPGAKQMYAESLEICQRIGDRSKAAGDLAGLGNVMRAAGEIEQSSKYQTEAISVFEEIGDKSSAAEVETGLAELLIDQGKPDQAAALALKAVDEFEREKAPRDESRAAAVLSRAFLAQGNVPGAQKEIEQAIALTSKYHDRDAELAVAVAAARVRAAAGSLEDRLRATNRLQQVLSDATKTGFVNYALEARLALGELEVTSGNRTGGRGHLESLLRDANEKGFGLVAQQANMALKQSASR
jgi:eukaryotic-like serine/threonine-protein kinase